MAGRARPAGCGSRTGCAAEFASVAEWAVGGDALTWLRLRCQRCRGFFSVNKGAAKQLSKIGVRKWLAAICMMTTNH